MRKKIVVLDFGSQYAHLIAKRFRMLGYYSEIALPSSSLDVFSGACGVVLSGGPSSVYEKNIPEFNAEIFTLDIPMLGLCYGHQLMAMSYGGKVEKAAVGEFGFAMLNKAADVQCPLFDNISFPSQVWMSHQDAVTVCPPGFVQAGYTRDCKYAALQNIEKKRYSLQFHVEVKDTVCGNDIFANFAKICGMEKNWDQDMVLNHIFAQIEKEAHGKKVLLFLSGGVDSTVAFALLNKALGQERVLGLHIDNGFMRQNESATIAERYKKAGFINFIVEDASQSFLKAVYHQADPQLKRKAVGENFITVRNEVVSRLNLDESQWLLAQGTLYPDIIESGGTKNSHVIKTHHNRVDGIQALIEKGLIIEPLKDLYKDEVRVIGRKIGLDEELVMRHPFPGPGLSINVLCSNGKLSDSDQRDFAASGEKVKNLNLSSFFTEKAASGVLPVKSVGVQGDFRTYRFPAVLSFGSIDALPPWKRLEDASSYITNSLDCVNRTVISLYERPNLQLREMWCDKERLDQTRLADAIVLDVLKKTKWYSRVFQHLTISLPYASADGRASFVLRPVVSEDVMTARFAFLDHDVLKEITDKISALLFVDAVYYDITNKPPATFGWE